jgi:hypothetical protein
MCQALPEDAFLPRNVLFIIDVPEPPVRRILKEVPPVESAVESSTVLRA